MDGFGPGGALEGDLTVVPDATAFEGAGRLEVLEFEEDSASWCKIPQIKPSICVDLPSGLFGQLCGFNERGLSPRLLIAGSVRCCRRQVDVGDHLV